MKKAEMVYIDKQGNAWITAEGVATLWNKRTQDEFHREGRYTRWSARNRVESMHDLPFIDTEDGRRLYSKEVAQSLKLRPRSKPRTDVTKRNQEHKPFTRRGEYSRSSKNSSQNT